MSRLRDPLVVAMIGGAIASSPSLWPSSPSRSDETT